MAGDEKKDSGLSGEALLTKTREWLETQGYPLEMEAAHAFREKGFWISQSVYYAADGVSREIDLTARLIDDLVHPDDRPFQFDTMVVAECKSSVKGNQAWVVFTTGDGLLRPFTVANRLTSPISSIVLGSLEFRRAMPEHLIFGDAARVGYAIQAAKIHAPKEERTDLAWRAVQSLAQAAIALNAERLDGFVETARITWPVLVVGGPLLECWIDKAGVVQLVERDEIDFEYRDPHNRRQPELMLRVIRASALSDFAARIQLAHADIVERFDDQFTAAVQTVIRRRAETARSTTK